MTALAKASVVFGYVCTLPFFGFQIKTHHLMGIILHWFNLPTDLELKLIRICFHFPDGNFRMTEVGHAMEHYISMAMPSWISSILPLFITSVSRYIPFLDRTSVAIFQDVACGFYCDSFGWTCWLCICGLRLHEWGYVDLHDASLSVYITMKIYFLLSKFPYNVEWLQYQWVLSF